MKRFFIFLFFVILSLSFTFSLDLNNEDNNVKFNDNNSDKIITATEVYDKMDNVLANLKSYWAKIKIRVYARTYNLGLTLYGQVFYKEPSKVKLTIDGLPEFLAKKYEKNFYATAIPGSTSNDFFRKKYNTKVLGVFKYRGHDCYLLKLNTKVRSSILVEYLWVRTDNFTVPLLTVDYRTGGKLRVEQFYVKKDGYYLLKKQVASFDFPNIKADAETTFLKYKLNIDIDDSVFEKK